MTVSSVPASARLIRIMLKSAKSFQTFSSISFDVHLVDELFLITGHSSEGSLNLLESTGSVLAFFTGKTRPLFDAFFKGFKAKVKH